MNIQPLVAEFLGTFFLCFAAIAAVLSATPAVGSGIGIVGVALANGFALSVAVNAFGGISGAHFNPAVSAAFLLAGRLAPSRFVPYVVVQLAAAACRALFLPEAVAQAQLGIPLPAAWASTSSVLLGEFILTFLLMTAIYGVALDERGKAMHIGGLGIGLTVGAAILAGGAVTGASMNPARSFGPALIHGNWQLHWAYWVAPTAGACAAALLYEKVMLKG